MDARCTHSLFVTRAVPRGYRIMNECSERERMMNECSERERMMNKCSERERIMNECSERERIIIYIISGLQIINIYNYYNLSPCSYLEIIDFRIINFLPLIFYILDKYIL